MTGSKGRERGNERGRPVIFNQKLMCKAMEDLSIEDQVKVLEEAIERKELAREAADSNELKASIWEELCHLRERLANLLSK